MRLHKIRITLLFILALIATYLTVYTAIAHNVARHVYDIDGTAVWRSAPSGSFFPWPRSPGMLMILSDMSEIDLFIYTYLIKSWALLGVTFLLWIAVSIFTVYILKLVRV